MALLFVRHGSTWANVGDPSDPKDYFRGSGIDAPMSDFGMKTAAQTAQWFSKIPVQAIISSPLIRAQQMAHLISQSTGVPVSTDQRLTPWHLGAFSGQPITPEGIKALDQFQKSNVPTPGGEQFSDFVDRTKSVLPEIIQAAQKANIAVVAHHRTALLMNSLMYNQPLTHKGPPLPGGVVAFTQKGMQQIFAPQAVKEQEGSKGHEGAPS